MIKFVLGKLLLIVPTFIGITIVAFGFVRVLPGDPILLMAGEHGISPERYQQLVHQFGYDKPIVVQYLSYVWNLLHGDFGISLSTKQPVLTEFLARFPRRPNFRSALCFWRSRSVFPPAFWPLSSAARFSIRPPWAWHSPVIRCRSSGGAFC
nr:hypothetical protein [Marinicella sp. W31]MDC2879456.1 hypothetical protein [Marinicella sp. W31]